MEKCWIEQCLSIISLLHFLIKTLLDHGHKRPNAINLIRNPFKPNNRLPKLPNHPLANIPIHPHNNLIQRLYNPHQNRHRRLLNKLLLIGLQLGRHRKTMNY